MTNIFFLLRNYYISFNTNVNINAAIIYSSHLHKRIYAMNLTSPHIRKTKIIDNSDGKTLFRFVKSKKKISILFAKMIKTVEKVLRKNMGNAWRWQSLTLSNFFFIFVSFSSKRKPHSFSFLYFFLFYNTFSFSTKKKTILIFL